MLPHTRLLRSTFCAAARPAPTAHTNAARAEQAHPLVAALSGGLLPFGSAAIELSSLYSSAWNGRIYSLFGFLFLTATTTALICAEVGVVLCYFQVRRLCPLLAITLW